MAFSTAMYDVIVIGAGIEGSSIAYTLAKEKKKVLLLEQFPLPHTRGSSHGQSRITRYCYEQDFYVRMMIDAFPKWAELEQETGETIFVNCGVLDLRQENSAGMGHVTNSLRKYNIPHEVLSSGDLKRQFPMITVGERDGAIYDPHGGILRADRAVRAYQTVFKRLGGVLHDGEPVMSITPGNDVTVVVTSRSVYSTWNVVISAGSWTGPISSKLGLNLPLQPVRITVLYWPVAESHAQDYVFQHFPCFIDSRDEASGTFHTYGLPASEYPRLVKICCHEGSNCNPNERDKVEDDLLNVDKVKEMVAASFPSLETTPAIKEYCIYTNTPDLNPFIDHHPEYPNIVIAAGFSGHGFKLAPAVGKAVAELVLKKVLTYNMQPFKLDRFSPQANL